MSAWAEKQVDDVVFVRDHFESTEWIEMKVTSVGRKWLTVEDTEHDVLLRVDRQTGKIDQEDNQFYAAASRAEIEEGDWFARYGFAVRQAVRACSDVAKLKQIAAILDVSLSDFVPLTKTDDT